MTAPEPRPPRHQVLPADCVELHALAFDLHASEQGTQAPEWVHLVPEGEVDKKTNERVVRGRDGRAFTIDSFDAVIAGSELPMQFDWEHLSMFGPLFGGDRATRAAGWIDQIVWLEEGDSARPAPGFWGHVARWTPDGRTDVEQGYYRGLSPVVRYQRREPVMEGAEAPPPLLRGLVNVALTNRPNLRMTLLHAEEPGGPMSTRAPAPLTAHQRAMAARMGLSEDAYRESMLAHERERAAYLGITVDEYRKGLAEGREG